MNATTIPCKRPKVTTDVGVTGPGGLVYLAKCAVPGCAWGYGPGVKTDVEQQATRHRGQHRDAVPRTHVFKPTIERPGYYASCYECMWNSPAGVSTRTDVQASLDYHLSDVHGLVTCS